MSLRVGKVVDLRSDTVTLPTEEMLEAIRHAQLGDDVYLSLIHISEPTRPY